MGKAARPGGKHVTIKDIARQLGISHATVSRALNDSDLIRETTKERIRKAAREMGYAPDTAARVMRGELSNIVGFILPDVQNHFYSAIATVLAGTVSAANLQLVLAISEDDPQQELRHVEALRRARARGIVITPVAGLLPETAAELAQMQVIQLVRSHPAIAADVVAAQDHEATRLSTRHLLGLGHRNIAYLGGGDETLSTGIDRLEGFRRAMAEAGLGGAAVRCVPPHPADGYRGALDLLRQPERPTALVISSSQLTLGALQAVLELGLDVPGDVSLISYDDPDWHSLWGPGLSTIALPIRQMAAFAAQRICNAAEPPAPPEDVAVRALPQGTRYAFPVELLKRGSCRRL